MARQQVCDRVYVDLLQTTVCHLGESVMGNGFKTIS